MLSGTRRLADQARTLFASEGLTVGGRAPHDRSSTTLGVPRLGAACASGSASAQMPDRAAAGGRHPARRHRPAARRPVAARWAGRLRGPGGGPHRALHPHGPGPQHHARPGRPAGPGLRGLLRGRRLHRGPADLDRAVRPGRPLVLGRGALRRRRGHGLRRLPGPAHPGHPRRLPGHRHPRLRRDHRHPRQVRPAEAVAGRPAGHPQHPAAHRSRRRPTSWPARCRSTTSRSPARPSSPSWPGGCGARAWGAPGWPSARTRTWPRRWASTSSRPRPWPTCWAPPSPGWAAPSSPDCSARSSRAASTSSCPSTWPPSSSSAAWAASRASSLGAIVLIGLPELFREFSEYRFLFYGIVLMFMMRFRPEGLWPSRIGRREMHGAEAPGDGPAPRRHDGGGLSHGPPRGHQGDQAVRRPAGRQRARLHARRGRHRQRHRAQRRRQDDVLQLHRRLLPDRRGQHRAGRHRPSTSCDPTASPTWASRGRTRTSGSSGA